MNILPAQKVESITDMLKMGFGIRKIMADIDVAKGTVERYRHILCGGESRFGNLPQKAVYCSCGKKIGHRGWCSFRVSLSPARQAFLLSHPAFGSRIASEKRKPIELDRYLRWPYVVYGKNVPDIIIKVHEVVPLTIPEKIRPDVCQNIIVDLLAGAVSLDKIPRVLRSYVNKAYREVNDYGVRSIYEDVKGQNGLMLIDTVSDNELWQ